MDHYGIRQEIRDLLRGVAGGLIFGTPILYTMEVWFEGQAFPPQKLFFILLASLSLNIFFSYFAGLREKHSSGRFFYALDDGVTSLGLGLVLALFILFLIGQLDFEQHFLGWIGRVIAEASIMSLGVTFTNFKFNKKQSSTRALRSIRDAAASLLSPERLQTRQDLSDLFAATVGALLFSFNVAPTEEITMIASNLSSLDQGLLLISEVIFAFIVLYASGLKEHVTFTKDNFFQSPLNETVLTVSVSLCISAVLISTIGYSDTSPGDPLFLSTAIVLGLPAVIGGAAGRLVV